jgi:predicted naringenin-chalcone synthase
MFITGIGTATPRMRYSKAQCLTAFEDSDWFARLDARAHYVARSVLQRDNGIDYRHLAVDSLDDVFAIDPDTLHQRFMVHAPQLALQAARAALLQAGLPPEAFGAVVVSTCTGYICPGLTGYVVEGLGLRSDVLAFDLVGQGCAAALPNMQLGRALLASGQCAHVLSVCVEVSSAAMYLDNDPGVLVSACLFGDGAGAAVLSQQPQPHTRCIEWLGSASYINPKQRSALMFEQRHGLLRNVLTRAVPQLAASAAQQVFESVMKPAGLGEDDVSAWIFHAGGRDVLLALERRFQLGAQSLGYSAAMLRQYGNLSSAFVYFVLQAAIADEATGGHWWLSSFGAGFSCHGALLKVDV